MKNLSIIQSSSKDVYHHLAVEKYLLTNLEPDSQYLYIWQSNNAVVVGKHQHIWKELNYKICIENGITMARRISGGGAVFMDTGNLNFTFISSRENYNNNSNFAILLRGLQNIGINAVRNKKNDLLFNNKKISGSSFCIKKAGVLHHATLLIDTDLSLLYQVLQPSFYIFPDHGVKSDHTEVTNIKHLDKNKTVPEVIEAMKHSFKEFYANETPSEIDNGITAINDQSEEYKEMSDQSWIFGRNNIKSLFPEEDDFTMHEKSSLMYPKKDPRTHQHKNHALKQEHVA